MNIHTETEEQRAARLFAERSFHIDGTPESRECAACASRKSAEAIEQLRAGRLGRLPENRFDEMKICVENMTGGDGFAAATYFADDSTSVAKELLVFGYGVCYRHDLGKEFGPEEVDFDRDAMYPIGTIDDRTWIVYTTPDQTLASILEKAKNGGIKMSGGNPLSDCHLSWGSLIAMEGGKPVYGTAEKTATKPQSALVVLDTVDAKVIKSCDNIEGVNTTVYNSVNVYDILNCDTLVVAEAAVKKIEEVYA